MNNEKELYGQQRLWGAISWGLSSFLSGIILDHLPIEFIFYAGATTYIGTFLLILFMLKINDLNSILKGQTKTKRWAEKKKIKFIHLVFLFSETDVEALPKVDDDTSSTLELSSVSKHFPPLRL